MKRWLAILLALLLSAGSALAETGRDLTAAEQARWQALSEGFRCPTCQGGSIADSPAGLSADLRGEVRSQIVAGKTDQEIRDFMVARYGDFISYEPPLTGTTAILWFTPFLFVVVMLLVLLQIFRHRRGAGQKEKS